MREGGADQCRIVGSGQVENEPGEKPPKARAQAENHKEVAVDLAKGALSEIARDEKAIRSISVPSPIPISTTPAAGSIPVALARNANPAIGARKKKVAT